LQVQDVANCPILFEGSELLENEFFSNLLERSQNSLRASQARFQVSERIGSRYLREPSPSGQTIRLRATFLRNRRKMVAAMNFSTYFRFCVAFLSPTMDAVGPLFFDVTEHPTGSWIIEQLMEAFRKAFISLRRPCAIATTGSKLTEADSTCGGL
jgi:hypothetical protein